MKHLSLAGLAAAPLVAAALAAPAAEAHPHMFVDARSTLVVDGSGLLTSVRSLLVIDPLTTQYVLEEFEMTLETGLTDEGRRIIAENMVEGLREYDYYTELTLDGAPLAFEHATISQVQLIDETLAAVLDLTLSDPAPLDAGAFELALFDPTYFAAVTTLGPPLAPEALDACRINFKPFEPQSLDAAALLDLSRLSREETPEEPRVGARFADRSRILCAG